MIPEKYSSLRLFVNMDPYKGFDISRAKFETLATGISQLQLSSAVITTAILYVSRITAIKGIIDKLIPQYCDEVQIVVVSLRFAQICGLHRLNFETWSRELTS